MNDKLIVVIAVFAVFLLLTFAYFMFTDIKVFLGCLCFLGAEKALDYIAIRKKHE